MLGEIGVPTNRRGGGGCFDFYKILRSPDQSDLIIIHSLDFGLITLIFTFHYATIRHIPTLPINV